MPADSRQIPEPSHVLMLFGLLMCDDDFRAETVATEEISTVP